MNAGRILLIAVIAFLAAGTGGYAARMLPGPEEGATADLHDLMHGELRLDAEQERHLADLERGFAGERARLETRLKSANARLAEAIAAEHVYGPRVSAAVDASHHAMGDLQKATLEHVFAMRAILRPDQQAQFDRAVDKALVAAAR